MSSYKILIVDDPENVNRIEDCLQEISCTMQSVCSGQAALKTMRNTDIDIFISRLELLDINGLAIYKAMKDQQPGMQCILITETSKKMEQQDCQRLQFFNRSTNMNRMTDCVNQAIIHIQKWQRAQKKILIVEDTKALLLTQQKMLKTLGFANILTANNGNHAIEMLLKISPPPDLIISDWYMPEKNGLELLQWLKRNDTFKTIPFIMATSKKEAMMAVDAGADNFLIKPYDIATIQKTIEKVL